MQVPWASWAVWASWAAGFLFGSGLVNTMYYCKINVLLNKLQLNTQERKKCRHFSWYPSYGKKYHTLLLLVSDSSPLPSPGGSHHFCLWLLMQHYPFHPSLQFPAILSKCWSFHLRLHKIWFMTEDHPSYLYSWCPIIELNTVLKPACSFEAITGHLLYNKCPCWDQTRQSEIRSTNDIAHIQLCTGIQKATFKGSEETVPCL